MITPVIMGSDSGTRLWPLSRAGHPKQFLALNGDKSMLQKTAARLSDLPTTESITICNERNIDSLWLSSSAKFTPLGRPIWNPSVSIPRQP